MILVFEDLNGLIATLKQPVATHFIAPNNQLLYPGKSVQKSVARSRLKNLAHYFYDDDEGQNVGN